MRLDAHHHLWRFIPADYPWIDPADGVLRRDFLLDELAVALDGGGVSRSLAVQARQSLDETCWLLGLAGRSRRLAGVVGWLPLQDPDLEDILAPLLTGGRLLGVRHVVQDEADPGFLLRPAVARGLALVERHGLAYDLLLRPGQLDQAIACVDAHPGLRFVLDHGAKPPLAGGDLAGWERGLRELARRPNLACKLSGLVTETAGPGWQVDDLVPVFAVLCTAFTPQRLMFGSDWPVCLAASGYRRWVEAVEVLIAPLTSGERAAIWSGTASSWYRLPED